MNKSIVLKENIVNLLEYDYTPHTVEKGDEDYKPMLGHLKKNGDQTEKSSDDNVHRYTMDGHKYTHYRYKKDHSIVGSYEAIEHLRGKATGKTTPWEDNEKAWSKADESWSIPRAQLKNGSRQWAGIDHFNNPQIENHALHQSITNLGYTYKHSSKLSHRSDKMSVNVYSKGEDFIHTNNKDHTEWQYHPKNWQSVQHLKAPGKTFLDGNGIDELKSAMSSSKNEDVTFSTSAGKGYGSVSKSNPDHAKLLQTAKDNATKVDDTGRFVHYHMGSHVITHAKGVDGSLFGYAPAMQNLQKKAGCC